LCAATVCAGWERGVIGDEPPPTQEAKLRLPAKVAAINRVLEFDITNS
jgi:hypothetical protein